MTNPHVTLRIRWTERRQIQPPPALPATQTEIVAEKTYEKTVTWDSSTPVVGEEYVLRLDASWTSDHTIESVQHMEDDRGTVRLLVGLSDYAYGGGEDDLVQAGFTPVD